MYFFHQDDIIFFCCQNGGTGLLSYCKRNYVECGLELGAPTSQDNIIISELQIILTLEFILDLKKWCFCKKFTFQ